MNQIIKRNTIILMIVILVQVIYTPKAYGYFNQIINTVEAISIEVNNIYNKNLNTQNKSLDNISKSETRLETTSFKINLVEDIKYKEELDLSQIDIQKYIEATDNVSSNISQINWKEVCAITSVLFADNLLEVSENDIENIASMFIENNNKLKSLEEVLENLALTKEAENAIKRYNTDLTYYGTHPERLTEDTKYIEFINSIKDNAIKNYENYKILPSITIAQAIVESGWGESDLAIEYNNLFGIKADTSWDGNHVVLATTEFSSIPTSGKFRQYENKNDSITDHAKFLYENERYESYGVFDSNTYINQANALEEAGYSTLTNDAGQKIYAEYLIDLIRQYNLQLIDSEVQSAK